VACYGLEKSSKFPRGIPHRFPNVAECWKWARERIDARDLVASQDSELRKLMRNGTWVRKSGAVEVFVPGGTMQAKEARERFEAEQETMGEFKI
jgi:hypothetical protein